MSFFRQLSFRRIAPTWVSNSTAVRSFLLNTKVAQLSPNMGHGIAASRLVIN